MVSTLKMEAAASFFEMLVAPAHFHSESTKKGGLTLTLDHHESQNSLTLPLLGFWTFSIIWYSREHDVSETGSVSVLR
jgi:hypothetical protein